jgi:hypothetical protein
VAEFAYNNAENATIGTSPFRALLGYDPNFQVRLNSVAEREAPAAKDRQAKLQELREKLQEHWRKATES